MAGQSCQLNSKSNEVPKEELSIEDARNVCNSTNVDKNADAGSLTKLKLSSWLALLNP